MEEVEIKLPDVLKKEKDKVKRDLEELVMFEAKRRALLEFTDEVMEGAKQLSDEELVELSRQIKKGRFEKLKKEGLV